MYRPQHILLMSGKRKCGKDFLAEALLERLRDKAAIVRISEPLKSQYALKHNLDLQALLSDGPYKEIHRKSMIDWSERVRLKDPGYFCQLACENGTTIDQGRPTQINLFLAVVLRHMALAPHCDTWIVSDIRRKSDIEWFRRQFEGVLITIRITADEITRRQRGWKFTPGVDDVTSECDLDDYLSWDKVICNDQVEPLDAIENLLTLLS